MEIEWGFSNQRETGKRVRCEKEIKKGKNNQECGREKGRYRGTHTERVRGKMAKGLHEHSAGTL